MPLRRRVGQQQGSTTGSPRVPASEGEARAGRPAPIEVRVEHIPYPQGSHFSPAKGVVKESNPRTEGYRQAVQAACERVLEGTDPLVGPVEAEFVFFMLPAPKSDPDREWPYYAPDLDKLVRATFDGITKSGAWEDDGRCVRFSAEKQHAPTLEETGTVIRLWSL